LVDDLSNNGAFSSDEKLDLHGDLAACSPCFAARTDGRFGTRGGGSDSAVDTRASSRRRSRGSSGTRLGRIRPVGRDVATSTGEGSVFCASNAAAAARCDSGSNAAFEGWVSDDCAFGFEVVASLGRRRTSTVNDGTTRLNVALATAHCSADSSRRRRSCEAESNKATGDAWLVPPQGALTQKASDTLLSNAVDKEPGSTCESILTDTHGSTRSPKLSRLVLRLGCPCFDGAFVSSALSDRQNARKERGDRSRASKRPDLGAAGSLGRRRPSRGSEEFCMPKPIKPQRDMLDQPVSRCPNYRIRPYADHALAALGRTPTREAGRKSADRPAMGA
jgi:hypothetical protein